MVCKYSMVYVQEKHVCHLLIIKTVYRQVLHAGLVIMVFVMANILHLVCKFYMVHAMVLVILTMAYIMILKSHAYVLNYIIVIIVQLAQLINETTQKIKWLLVTSLVLILQLLVIQQTVSVQFLTLMLKTIQLQQNHICISL